MTYNSTWLGEELGLKHEGDRHNIVVKTETIVIKQFVC